MTQTDENVNKNNKRIIQMEKKLAKAELHNKTLSKENAQLKERLLEVEYRQRCNNLIFEGIGDCDDEADVQCINKLRSTLSAIPGLDQGFKIERCHRLDGSFKQGRTRRVICAFNWYVDVSFILKNQKHLPKGIYVSEDYPEEWVDRRKVLKPLFNAAKRRDNLKYKTHLNKDRLVIDSHIFTVGPTCNIQEANSLLDVSSSYERSDAAKVLFLGSLLPFSNLYQSKFSINNVEYNCVEQYIQSEKAAAFNNDLSHNKIMRETNPYSIKKMGSRIRGYTPEQWRKLDKQIAMVGVMEKFRQNNVLKDVLLATGDKQIVESSYDLHWGSGLHLRDKKALDKQYWINKKGGMMSEVLNRVRETLCKESN